MNVSSSTTAVIVSSVVNPLAALLFALIVLLGLPSIPRVSLPSFSCCGCCYWFWRYQCNKYCCKCCRPKYWLKSMEQLSLDYEDGARKLEEKEEEEEQKNKEEEEEE